MSGKVCTHGDMYFAVNSQTGKIHTAKMCNPFHGDPTPAQVAQREAFAKKSKLVASWLAKNKPSAGSPDGSETYQKVLTAYKSQHTIGSLYGYVSKLIADDGTVTIGTSTSSGSTPSGGGSSSDDEGSF